VKALLFEDSQISIQNVAKPILGRNQALIQVKAVGICGTDLAIVKGHLPTPTPIILGHESLVMLSKLEKMSIHNGLANG